MNGVPKTEKTLEERGIPSHSFFTLTMADGSTMSEHQVNWSEISEETMVDCFGSPRLVRLCTMPVKAIAIAHDGIETMIEVADGDRVYQSIRGQSFVIAGAMQNKIVGRYIGVVKNGEVIEEKYIDGLQFEVRGMRK